MTNFGSDNSEEMTVFVRPGGRSWRQEQEAGSRSRMQGLTGGNRLLVAKIAPERSSLRVLALPPAPAVCLLTFTNAGGNFGFIVFVTATREWIRCPPARC